MQKLLQKNEIMNLLTGQNSAFVAPFDVSEVFSTDILKRGSFKAKCTQFFTTELPYSYLRSQRLEQTILERFVSLNKDVLLELIVYNGVGKAVYYQTNYQKYCQAINRMAEEGKRLQGEQDAKKKV